MNYDQAPLTKQSHRRVRAVRSHVGRFARHARNAFRFSHILVLVLCYGMVVQPNAALAVGPRLIAASSSAVTPSAKETKAPSAIAETSNATKPATPPALPVPTPVAAITDAVVSRHKPTLTSGRIEGTLRVLQGESFTISNSAQLLADVFLPGTPAIQLNSGAQHGGLINDGGSATPTGYTVTLGNNAILPGRIHTRADALTLPSDFPTSVPASPGTRSVTVRFQSDIAAIGNWQTVRDLNVAGSGLTVNMPPGNYGTLTINGNSQVNLSAGVYNFANTFNLDGSARLQSTGLVAINVAQDVTINSGALTLGSYTAPADVHLNVLGILLKINGSSQVNGLVRAYNATATLNNTSLLRGQLIANSVSLTGGKVIGAVWPVQSGSSMMIFGPRRFDRTTGPPNQYVEQFSLPSGVTSPYTLHIQNGAPDGSNRVSSATVKLNGVDVLTPSDLNQNVAGVDRVVTLTSLNQLDVRVASSPGSYLIINIGGTMPTADTAPPVLAITAPANNTTTADSSITVGGTATDSGTGATGVAHVYVNNVEATYNASTGAWTLADVALNPGANPITARAVDHAGNPATASITVTRAAPANLAPEVSAGTDQPIRLPHDATLHGTATDDGLPQGSSLTTTWSIVSGEGTVTFADAQALNTTASFSMAGTYVLRLTASDSALSTNDEVTITVDPQNQPPTVSAGSNQTIALPRTAALNGTVTDDGLPAGSTVSLIWTKVSGPGSVTFEAPTLADTSAAFSAAGEYVLQLSASDSDLGSTSEITITVQPQNQAPTVSAGPDQTISLPSFAQLNGSVSDDGWPSGSSLTTQWTVVSGPGPVMIDNPNVTVTTASFSEPGPYVLRLTGSDSDLSNFDELTINVVPPADHTVPTLFITSHADNSTTQAESVTLSGTVFDPGQYASGIAQVTVKGVAASLDTQSGTWSSANLPLEIGPNTITVIALDHAGNQTTRPITINRATPPDRQAPTISVTSPLDNFISPDATITITGTATDEGPYATGVLRVMVNGQQANYDSATHQWTATGIPLNEGPNTIQVIADDNATPTNARDAIIHVTRHTPDTQAPTITITSPISSFETYDGTLSVAGMAADDGLNATGVNHVNVNGINANYNASTGQWSVPSIPLAYGDNDILVIATDKATTPNQGSAHVHVTRLRIPAPTLTISNPQNGAVLATTSITVAGSVSSLGSAVTVTVNGQNAPVSGGQFARAVSLVEGANTITVVATDSIAQQSQASISVIRDLSPPAVSFSNVPASVQPGGTYQILVDATDNVGVADVEFRLNGQYIATAATAPYQFTLDVSSVYAAGNNLVLSAVARDLTNTTAVATAQTRIGGPGGVSGYVFDDTTGYVIPGANALLNNNGSAVTDELGVFNLISSTPSGVVRLSKGEHTSVERLYSVSIGEGTALFDARLTPLDSQVNQIGIADGTAHGDGGRLQVNFPAGTFSETTEIRVTSVSPQGLANLLPYGWSPVPGAVVDLRSSSATVPQVFAAAVHLTISQVPGLTSATPLTLARYDELSHRWMVVGTGIIPGGGALSADLPRMGQYAFLVADSGSTAPPAPVIGDPLTSAQPAESASLDKAQANAVATPRTAVFSANARSAISFFATAPTQLPSGVAIEATFGETYNLLGGRDSVLVDRPAQDFVLYAFPAASTDQPNRLSASFVAKPTRTDFTITELFNANVHVEIRSGRQTKLGALIDGSGGGVRASDGSQLTIPANALPGSQSVFFNDLSAQLANVVLPDGYEIVGAFDVDLGSAVLNSSATISVPGVSGDLSRIVVARLMTVGGQRSPKVVARALADSSGKLISTTATPPVPAGVELGGIRISGRYLFIRLPQPFGYVKGIVSDAANGTPLGMVKVSNNQTPFIDVTTGNGQFVVIGSSGPDASGTNQIGAAALNTDATGSATASLAAQDAVANVNISASALALQVESITPASNAQNMIATTPVTVTFNKPIAPTSVTGSSFLLSTAAGNPVLGNITVLAGNRVVVFTPAATLAASTSYRVTLTQSIRDIYGHQLSTNFNSTFTTAAAVTVGNRLRPEQIVIGYPDANGISSILIPAQSVPEGSTLLVVNTTSGSTLSTVAGTSALTLQIQARVGDEITITISQPDGTQYRVTQAAYRRADGFISVGSNGGTITSDDGQILLSVPTGAISGQADLKLTRRVESDITIPRQGDMDPGNVPFGAGVRINIGGNFTNNQELHLEVAAPPTAAEGQRVAFMKPAKFTEAGVERDVWEVITSGKTEGGKFKTMSPPFFGISIASNVSFYDSYVFTPRNIRAITGIVTEHVNNGAPKPLGNVVVRMTAGAGNPPASVLATSAANGRFATLDYAVASASSVDILATDPLGRTRSAGATPYLNSSPSQNPGLIGLSSMYAAIEFPSSDGLPETLPALLHMEGRMLDLATGQPDTLQSVGRVLLGSHLEIKTTATPDVKQISGQLLSGGTVVRQLVWTNTSPGSGVYVTDFTADSQGSFSVAVTTHTQANVPTTKATAAFNFVALADPNTRPSLEGPPRVLSVTPADKAEQVNTGSRIHIEFSEPVKNLVAGQTIYLTNLATGAHIGGDITSGGLPIGANQQGISSVDLQPSPSLESNKEYAVEVTTGVKDSNDHPLDQEYSSPTDTNAQPFHSTFKTFHSFVLTETPPLTDSYRIAAAGDLAITVTPTFGSSMHIWDITNPAAPALIANKFVPNYAIAFDIADAELDEDFIKVGGSGNQTYRTIAVVASLTPQDTSRPINLWIFSLDDPANSKMIGVVSLNISNSVPAFPTYVKIHHKRAYIGNSGRGGVEVVDLQDAVNKQAQDGLFMASLLAVQPNGGYSQEAKKQKATYGHSNNEAAPVFSVSMMDQNVPASGGAGAAKSPVAYIASNKLQLISFDHNATLYDNHFVFTDTNGDTFDDLLLAASDLSPAGYAVDVRAVPSVNVLGQATDLAVLLGAERLWLFDVTNPRDPHPYPSRSFSEMGLGPDYARRMDVEGTLAYVMFTDKVAVIDFSDPTRPFVSSTITDIGTNLRWLTVKDGFVYTLDSIGDTRTAKFRASIGGAAALVYMHGANTDPDNVCANPVLISRADRHMLQPAEMIFKVYGHDKPVSTKVIIRREIRSADQTIVETLATVAGELDPQSPPNIVVGKAKWTSSAPIDRASLYTAELILDEGQPTEFRARQAEIPFSNLIDQYQDDWAIPQQGGIGHLLYLLGGSATLTLMVNGPNGWNTVELQNGNTRAYGLHNEEMLRSLVGLNNLPPGRYQFSLTAQAVDLVGVNETVLGEVTIGDVSKDIRVPGSVLVAGVELETGNLGLTHTDISEIKNRGLSLSFTRSYNSAASSSFNPLGYGWRHNYQVLLVHHTQGTPNDPNRPAGPYYEISGGEGSGHVFVESEVTVGAEAQARAPHQGTLRRNADETFDYFTKAHVKYHFQQEIKAGSVQNFNLGYMGNLSYIEEPNGNKLTLNYDGQGRLFSVADSSGRKLEFTYEQALTPFVGTVDAGSITGQATNCTSRRFMRSLRQRFLQAELGRAWHIIQVKGSGGIEINYDYDGFGNLARATRTGTDTISQSTGDSIWQYAYNPTAGANANPNYNHLLKSVKPPNQSLAESRLTKYDYELNQPGRPVKTINMPENVSYGYSYTFVNGQVTAAIVTDGRDNSTNYQFVTSGNIKTVTSVAPRGAQSVTTFDDHGNRLTEVDPEGMTTTYRYENGNPVEVVVTGQGLVQRRVATYDATFNKLTSLTDANQQTTSYTIDGRGNITRVQLPTGRAVTMDYKDRGDLERMTDQYGFVTTYENHDIYGNPQTVRRQTSGANFVISHQTFDERSRRKNADDDLGPTESLTYDALDHLIQRTVTDPAGFRETLNATMTYLPEGQLKSTTQSGGNQQMAVVNEYDGLNRIVLTTETPSGAASFARPFKYDRNSNLEEETDRRGVKRINTYDALNFVTSETLSGPYGASLGTMTALEIDKVGNPKQVRNLYGQTMRMDYDGLHRLAVKHLPGNFTEEFGYDANGNLTSSKDRNGRETRFEYDPGNRQKLMRDPGGRITTWAYDDSTRSVTINRDPQGSTEVFQEDALGRILRHEERFGSNNYVTTNVYLGRRITTTDPRSTVSVREISAFSDIGHLTVNGADPAYMLEMRYAALGGMRSSKDALSRETTYTLDGRGRATQIGHPGGFSESFSYDGEGLVLSHTDRRGAVTTMTYDNLGRKLTDKVLDGAQQVSVLTVQYDDAGNRETHTDADGHATVSVFDGLRRVNSLTNADSKTKTYVYDGMNLRQESDFKGVFTDYQYDDLDRVKLIRDRKGQVVNIINNDSNGYTKTTTDRRGSTHVEVFDPLGRLVNETLGGEPLVSYRYDGNNNRIEMVDAVGNPTTYTYDKLNRVKTISHATIQTETFTYDAAGNVLAHNDGRGPSVSMEYDELNHLKSRTDGEGNVSRLRYDGEGLLLDKTDPKSAAHKTTYNYNALGSLKKITDARSGVWEFEYDGTQDLRSVKDALSRVVAYDYDSLNRLERVTQPQNLVTSYGYDANNNRNSVTDPKGQTTTIVYDALDRPDTLAYANTSGAGPLGFDFDYDPENNLTSVAEKITPTTTRNYARSYDARNRLQTATDPFNRTVTFAYFPTNTLKSIKDAAQKETTYSYDPLNRLQNVTMTSGVSAAYSWYADGLLKEVSYGAGMKREYAYDNADRLTQVTNTIGTDPSLQTQQFVYGYDPNSNRQNETRKVNGQTTRGITYNYDLLDRLTSASYTTSGQRPADPPAGQSANYTEGTRETGFDYDAVGNRTTANAQDHSTTITLTTDNNGATTESRQTVDGPLQATTAQFDQLNRLSQLTNSAAGSVPTTYAYDNNGNLISTTQNNQLTAQYEYDCRDQLRRVLNGSSQELASYDYDFERHRISKTVGAASVKYVYGGDQVIGEYNASNQLQNRYDLGANEVVRGELGGEGTRHYFSDGLNSVTALGQQPTTASSSLTATFEYDAWGNSLGTSGGSNNSIGYTGQRFDNETGLMPLGNGERYYSPTLGSFIQQDSFTGLAATAHSMNRYAYAHNNPLRFIDRNGNKSEEPTNDPDVVEHVAEGIGNFLWNLLEPVRQIADVLVADAAANEGIDAKYVKMSSNLGKSSQEAVLAGQDPWDVALNSIHGQIYGYATLGIPQLVEPITDMVAYYDGKISLPEYNKRMGGHLGNFGLLYAGARAARGGAGQAKPSVLAEKPAALASERLPLKTAAAESVAPPRSSKSRFEVDAEPGGPARSTGRGNLDPRGGQVDFAGAANTGGVLGPAGPEQFVMQGGGPLHTTVGLRRGDLVNRVFDSGFATNPKAAQPLGRYFGEGGILPPTAAAAITEFGLNLPGIINDAHMGAVYRANAPLPALRGPALGGTATELIINPSHWNKLDLQGGYSRLP